MLIRPEDRAALVFDAYRFYEVLQAGRRLRIGDLEDRWRYSGLRRSDLDIALAEQVAAGLLSARDSAFGMTYTLTEAGAAEIRDNPASPEVQRALYQFEKRPRCGDGWHLERRKTASA